MSLGFKALFKIDRVLTDGFLKVISGTWVMTYYWVRLRGWSSSMQGLTAWA